MTEGKATIREWLTEAGFDWTSARIVLQASEPGRSPGWAPPLSAEEIGTDHPILDHKFYDGHGGPECPRFIAEDATRIYFPDQYDGATGLVTVWKDIGRYLDWQNHETPYPGG